MSAVAVTADSPSVARTEIDDARRLARQIGIRHEIVHTDEFSDPLAEAGHLVAGEL